MEIHLSRARLMQVAAALFIVAAAVFASRAFLHPKAEERSEEYNQQPAMQALSTIYAPGGEQDGWEQSACENMTVKGCEIFRAYYANPIWQTDLTGTHISFTGVRDILNDGTQVWQTEAAAPNGNVQPIFIQVEQRADGQWLLARILFEEEAQKYAQ